MEQVRDSIKEQWNTLRDDHQDNADGRRVLTPARMQESCWLTRKGAGRQTQVREKRGEDVRRIARENAWQIGR